MGPADLCNQGLHFWQVAVCEIKFPHVEYISAGIAADAGKLLSQVCGKLLGDSSAMVGVDLPFDNQLADVPVKRDQLLVDCFEVPVWHLKASASSPVT